MPSRWRLRSAYPKPATTYFDHPPTEGTTTRTHIGEFELRFPLNQVSTIAEHAMAATEHSWPTWDDNKPNPIPPALAWAKDQGTYLLSNGVPRLLADPAKPDGSSQVVYALGYDSYFNFTDTAVGGDDFAEYISLTDKQDGVTLIELIGTVRTTV